MMSSLQANFAQNPTAGTKAHTGKQAAGLPRMVSGYGQYHSNEPGAKARKPYSSIDLAGVRALVDNPQSTDKALAQWLIPSTLHSRVFATQEKSGAYWLLWADLDTDPKPISEVDTILQKHIIPGYDFELYSSKSAREDCQKARILIPLNKPLSGGDWGVCQSIFFDKLAGAGITPDRAALRSAQLCYLPNRGAFYVSRYLRGGCQFDPLAEWAGEIAAISQAAQALHIEAKAAAQRRETLRLSDAPDTIGAFNRAYSVQEILQRANYAQRGNSFRHPKSESGSFSASVKGGRVHSLSSSDPLYTGGAGGGAHDAFSAFCTLWARGDMAAALKLAGDDWLSVEGVPWNKAKQRDYASKQGFYQGKRKACYFAIGDIGEGLPLLICEGFATGATLHEATGYPVAVAFDAGNLDKVAKALRKKFPDAVLIICGDDDHAKPINTGRKAANGAALAVGAAVVFPVFSGDRGADDTDFNDLEAKEGPEAVAGIIKAAAARFSGPVASDHGAAISSHQEGGESASGVDSEGRIFETTDMAAENAESIASGDTTGTDDNPFPSEEARPCYVVLDDWQEMAGRKLRPGVYFCGMTAEKKDTPPMPFNVWFCSPLHIDALICDEHGENFGRLLRFKNSLGKWREWAMPMDLLKGHGDELRGALLGMGVELEHGKARSYLPAYLQWRTPARRMRCAVTVGWSGKLFVLPDAVIGQDDVDVVFQSEGGHHEYATRGTIAEWKERIAAKAVGNQLLMLALSAAFAGPVLARCNMEGGGIHFVGDSSTGKTTLIEAACSVWGGKEYRRSWRTTANGMEGAAALFNDCLLALDEIGECDPREVGKIVYSLGNGRGKQRAKMSGAARSVTRWRCSLLSSGETSIATAMQEGGHRVRAGQSVRLLDLPIDRPFGAWDMLHGAATPAGFSDAIKRGAEICHGTAGRAFLEFLTRDATDYAEALDRWRSHALFASGDDTAGQERRAAARLALIGMAGELATDYGLTGWKSGDAMKSAAFAFNLWLSQRGKGNTEKHQVLERIAEYLERFGDTRFTDADANADTPPPRGERAGWWRETHDGRVYLLTAAAMKEALHGFDFKRSLSALVDAGALVAPNASGERARFFRVGGRPMKLYQINPERLEGGGDVG